MNFSVLVLECEADGYRRGGGLHQDQDRRGHQAQMGPQEPLVLLTKGMYVASQLGFYDDGKHKVKMFNKAKLH